MNKTGIQYLDYTWNPIAMRCTPISEGCANCWHQKAANRLSGNPKLPYHVRMSLAGTGDPCLVPSRMEDPGKVKKSSMIGVQFMGDLFYSKVLGCWIDDIFWKIGFDYIQHTFLVLTKRPLRAQKLLKRWCSYNQKTFPNIYLGVSVENQQTADERIPILLQIPAAKRFVSVEPMLGPVDLRRNAYIPWIPHSVRPPHKPNPNTYLDWVIAGCESGSNRRPADIDWFRSLRDQCVEAGVPFFLKQMEIDGKVVSMPELDGVVWDQMPEEVTS